MKNLVHTFSSVEEMAAFVSRAEACEFDVDICCDHFVIDGKSLMGVMNIGLGRQVEIVCHDSEFSPENLVGSVA